VKPRPVTREALARQLRCRRATIEGVGRLIARTLNRPRPRLSQMVIQVTHSVTTLMVWSMSDVTKSFQIAEQTSGDDPK
jgi:hypothetical protein